MPIARYGLALLVAVISGCGTETIGQVPRTVDARSTTELLAAERVALHFTTLPVQVELAIGMSGIGRATPASAGADALRTSARQAYAAEWPVLRVAVERVASATSDPRLAHILADLARVQGNGARPSTSASDAQDPEMRIAARPDREELLRLAGLMAQPHFAEDGARTAQRVKIVLDDLKGDVSASTIARIRSGLPQLIAATRANTVEEMLPGLNVAVEREGARGALAIALLSLPPADVATLLRWYEGPQGRTVTGKLVGAFHAANDRADRAMLEAYLGRWDSAR